MKRIILTESQYKRLVRQPLNESGRGDIIFENPEDEKDVDADITWLLVYLRNQLYELHQKNVFVKRIEGGKVYLDATKYTDKEVETINYLFSKFSEWKQGYKDQIVGLPKDLTFDIGHDTDYVFNVDTDDDDVVDTDDDDVVDTDDVANVEYDIDKTYSRGEYINLVKNIAIQQMENYKIPASVTIAQAILESGDGNSDLAKKGKNHFGVKCHGWSGDKSYHDDDKPNECFRNYDNISDSFEDHSIFLKGNDRYKTLFDLDITDYKGWSQGLKNAGYATSPSYANKLISIIEDYNLGKYDKQYSNVEVPPLGGGSSDTDMNLETPKSTGNYFRKGNNKLYGKSGHSGHDYIAVNNPIVYMKKGKVKYASFDNNSCGGTITIVPDGEDRKAIFCHMSEIYVTTGENIEAGTTIGVSGGGKGQKGAGHSTGHHLHFGMKNSSDGGKFIDPNDYIDDIKIIRD
jgi:flagellum-specific peptidoglycan hydrolase FlgJ